MFRYFSKKPKCVAESSSAPSPLGNSNDDNVHIERRNSEMEFNLNDIVSDPGLRIPIESYDVGIRDRVRREYISRGPCQPISHEYPRKKMGQDNRCFRDTWFENRDWLEYSIAKDAAFCFYCYLFRPSNISYKGDDAFTKTGFSNWKKAVAKFNDHVGCVRGPHNQARVLFEGFANQRQSVTYAFSSGKQSVEVKYRKRLTSSLKVIRFLLRQGLAFRGNDESSNSSNKGNFLELLDWLSENSEEVSKEVRENAPGNSQLTSPNIQKQLTSSCAFETTLSILADLGDGLFTVMVDESRDSSVKEQMAVVIRFVNRRGEVVERFLGIVHVAETRAICLKEAIDSLFAKYRLSISSLRGQGYDGASNMRGEFNGLKSLILKENPNAMYIHCFAHQLQLIVVAVCQANRWVDDFFTYLNMIVTTCGSSCKRADMIRQKEHKRMVERLENLELSSGTGQNQATSLARPCDTRWGTHYTTICRLQDMWPSVLSVLQAVFDDGELEKGRGVSASLIKKMEKYDFVFIMILMRRLLGMTNCLSLLLQEKDQNIVNAIHQINLLKENLQEFREAGWVKLMKDVEEFCVAYSIPVIDMTDIRRKGSRFVRSSGETITNHQFFRVEIFCEVVDLLRQEMENRFSETSTELLTCISCLSPRFDFNSFNVDKLVRLAHLYPDDFSFTDRSLIKQELETYIQDLRTDARFNGLQDLGSLAKKMVETMKYRGFPLVYRLTQLALLLPVATASVERVFSAMNIVKNSKRNKMGDEWLNDSLVVFIERDVFATIEDESILQRFQKMDNRRNQLSRLSTNS